MKAKLEVPFFKPSFSEEEEQAVLSVLRSGWLTTGKEAAEFEREFASFLGAGQALAVNSASSGLLLAMEAFGVRPGTCIVTTPYTFISTATAAMHLGAEVLYCDIEEDSYNIDPQKVEDMLRSRKNIRAVVPVHVAGNLCRMDAIKPCAERYHAAVIEDAAHAFPANGPDGFAGTLGDAGVFSFYATKTITTGEGGMITLRDPGKAETVKRLRANGISREVWDRYTNPAASWKYDVTCCGWKCNLPDLLAAIGRVQLKKAGQFLARRKAIAETYNRSFASCGFLRLPPDSPGNAWHLYLLRIQPEKLTVGRDEFARLLQNEGLGISVHFIPHFDFTFIRRTSGLSRDSFPEAAKKADCTVSLPFWPDMRDEEIQYVIDTVKKIGEQYYRKSCF